MSRYDGPYGCCDTLAVVGPIEHLTGHHPLCPRFGLAAIERRATEVAADDEHFRHAAPRRGLGAGVAPDMRGVEAHDDRAVLLAAVKELRARRVTDSIEESQRAESLRTELEADRKAAEEERDDARRARDDAEAQAKELQAEVARLRPIVEQVAAHDGADRYQDECWSCGLPLHKGNHTGECLGERARAALRPAGTLASIPADACEDERR